MLDSLKTGEFIREARKKKGLSQNDLAEKLNITRVAVSKWENGHNLPDIVIMKELAEILDVDINEIMEGENIEHEETVPVIIKKKNYGYIIAIAVIVIAILFGNMKYSVSWSREDMLFQMEKVYSYGDNTVTGILYYLIYDQEQIKFTNVEVKEFELTDDKGTPVSVLVIKLSRSGWDILSGRHRKTGQEILTYLRCGEDLSEGYKVLCYYTGNLNSLNSITELNVFLEKISSSGGSYYAFTE